MDAVAAPGWPMRCAPIRPCRPHKRVEVARFVEDLKASYRGSSYSVISLHGSGSAAATEQEIRRQYPVGEKVALVEKQLNRGVLTPTEGDTARAITCKRRPGRRCDTGCSAPGQAVMVPLPEPGRRG